VSVDVARMKQEWAGKQFDEKEFTISVEAALEFALACGETDPRFTDPHHPDFQAPCTATAQFTGARVFPDALLPLMRKGVGFDAGKCVVPGVPIRPGERLIGRSEIHDIYEKTGRSGRMMFVVHRMTFTNPRGEVASVVDWRMVVREPNKG